MDSLYIAAIQVMKWNTDMSEEPVPDIDILFYVPRLFSLLPVGEAYTNKQGSDEFEFPMDLPGQNGELTIVSRIEDHDDFGTIEVSNETNWGVPIANGNSKLPRALWSPDAPMWMLISFFILMAGVWGHYLYVVINMFQIQKSGNVNDALNYIE
ncbi:MAG: hypothetical protein HC811_03025 [Flammeovirgaceae bacterium]|nr:hypothetical protein [Flammeovirgaceae bacterium]